MTPADALRWIKQDPKLRFRRPKPTAPKRRPVRVLIINAFAVNGGDAALLLATLSRCRDAWGPEVEARVHDSAPNESASRYPEITFCDAVPVDRATARSASEGSLQKVKRFADVGLGLVRLLAAAGLMSLSKRNLTASNRIARRLARPVDRPGLLDYAWADVVISSAGTNIVEHYRLEKRWASLVIALWLHKPLVLFTQSLGPFKSTVNRRMMRYVGTGATLVLLRDERSKGHLIEIGVPDVRLRVTADAAFGLSGWSDLRDRKPQTVGVSVRHWPYGQAVQGVDVSDLYRRGVAGLVERLVDVDSLSVTFLSTCQGEADLEDDSLEALKIVEMIRPELRDRVTVDRDVHTPEELIARFGAFDRVVATRMHAAILSVTAGTPVLPIAYEFKMSELFGRLGLAHCVVSIDQADSRHLLDAWNRLEISVSNELPSIRDAVAAQRTMALEDASYLRSVLPVSPL